MIYQSAPWKEQLLRDAARLRRIMRKRIDSDGGEKDLFQLERLVFLSAYTMRKLWEADKLSSNWNHQRLRCLRFPIKGDASPTQLNWHDLDRHYDLETSSEAKIRPDEFCDRIIHSFIFSPSIGNEATITEFYFTSDTMRHRSVWLIGLDVVANLMTTSGKDYPSSGRWVRRADGQFDTWTGHGEPPLGWTKSKRRT